MKYFVVGASKSLQQPAEFSELPNVAKYQPPDQNDPTTGLESIFGTFEIMEIVVLAEKMKHRSRTSTSALKSLASGRSTPKQSLSIVRLSRQLRN